MIASASCPHAMNGQMPFGRLAAADERSTVNFGFRPIAVRRRFEKRTPNVEPSGVAPDDEPKRETSRRPPAALGYASLDGGATVPLIFDSLNEMNGNAVPGIFGDARAQRGFDWQLVRSVPKGHE